LILIYTAFLFFMRIALIRHEDHLLLALAGKHVQFKEFVASSLGSLSKLDFSAGAHIQPAPLPCKWQRTHQKVSCCFAHVAAAAGVVLQLFDCSQALAHSMAAMRQPSTPRPLHTLGRTSNVTSPHPRGQKLAFTSRINCIGCTRG